MANVWFVGSGSSRTISSGDWDALGITADASTWSAVNGWSLPESMFNSDQLNVLQADVEFLRGQTGVRNNRSPVTEGDSLLSGYVYYIQIREMYDQLIGGGVDISGAIDAAIATVIGTAPGSLDTLGEIATVINAMKAGADPAGDTFAELFAVATAKYTKPGGGIPKTDLSSALQDLIDKIDSAPNKTPRRTPNSNRAVLIGDSIGVAGPDGSMLMGDSWFTRLCVESEGRIQYHGAFATGGMRLTAIQSTWLPTILALDPAPAACFIQNVTNDIIQDAGAWSMNASITVWKQIVDSLLRVGIIPIGVTALPVYVDQPVMNANVVKWNLWLKRYCGDNGFPVVDSYSALVQDNGFQALGLSSDYIHPTSAGCEAIVRRALTDGIA